MTTANPVEDLYELTPVQHGMLFHDQFAPGSGLYIVQFVCTIEGALKPASFEQAWLRVAEVHPILRTAFHWRDLEKPLQVVARQARVPFATFDWREAGTPLQQFLAEDRARGFDLEQAPLMRCALCRTGEERWEFVWTFHHLLLDGWSTSLVLRDVLTAYEYLCRGVEPKLEPAGNFSAYLDWLQRQDAERAKAFWSEALAGASVPMPLPLNGAASGEASTVSATVRENLSIDVTARLKTLARQHQLTLNHFVQGAWALMLNRYSGADDIVFGATVSGRPAALNGVERIAGMFINTLPVRARIDPEMPLISWLREIGAYQREMQEFESTSLVDVQKWTGLPRLFDSIVVFENYPVEGSLADAGLSIRIGNLRSAEKTNFPLTLVAEPGASLGLKLDYDPALYSSESASRLLRHTATLLTNMAANPEARAIDVPMLTGDELRQITVDWNQAEPCDVPACAYHELFERQAALAPEAVALRCKGRAMTYGELDRKANQLAHSLIARGVKAGDRIGIRMPRSFDMVTGLLAVLKTGSAYVPLDSSYPEERLRYMIADAGIDVVLESAHATGMPESNPGVKTHPGDLVYMIYTSGSTGRPKGVMISHGGLVNYVTWAGGYYFRDHRGGAPVQSPFGFDLTVTSLLVPLATGRAVDLLSEEDSVQALGDALESPGGYGLLKLTPAHVEILNRTVSPAAASRAAGALVIGGEALWAETLEFWRQNAPRARLINEYGPTEITVASTIYEVPAGPLTSRSIPIGYPIANTRHYVLDRYLRPVPVGAAGELFIGGAGVAHGYFNRPELTAEKFVPDSFTGTPGARLYRTGDLARYRHDGVLEYLGRVDHQVKVRGFRIEPGEIETALLAHPGIREALAVTTDGPQADKQLIAYVVPEAGANLEWEQLRAFLSTHLPPYMIPSLIVPLEAFPLTANGKVDRGALPGAGTMAISRQYAPPEGPLEQILEEIFTEVLAVDRIGRHGHFFELGGHSLLATQLVSRIADAMQLQVPLRRVFESPTPALLAASFIADPQAAAAIAALAEIDAELAGARS